MRRVVILMVFAFTAFPGFAERALVGEVIVDGPVAQVWQAWTSSRELNKWFGADSKVELRPGGAFEIYFDAKTKVGCNGCTILAVQPEKLLSFTWNAPPHLPEARAQFTHVTVRLEPVGEKQTKVTFREDGWGDGGQWDEAYRYFERAWLQMVLPNLQKHFTEAEP